MSLESGAAGALLAKYGWLKLATLGSALLGATLMAVFRPPKTRKEVLLHALVALGGSFLFGNTAHAILSKWVEMDLTAAHGLVGALSWGAFGGLATFRDKFESNPVEAVKNVKDVL